MCKKVLGLAIVLGLSLTALAQQTPPAAAQAPRPPTIKTHLKVGDMAPDFTLPGTDGKNYKLSDFRGQKNVVLAFYVLAFTGG
jgi:cytochrome oxidase Cu insertion factor (SCO1/SenC/PrrC family)